MEREYHFFIGLETCQISSFRIVQAVATLTAGIVLGLAFVWKLGLVGLGQYVFIRSRFRILIPLT